MKKILFSIVAVLALAAGCQQFEPEVSRDSAPEAAAPSIAVSNVTDDAFSFTVTGGEGTGYFSYVVVEGTKVPSATKIFKVSASGIAEGTVDYSKTKSVTVALEELDFNTPYTICAVAGSVDGDLTQVVTKTVTTSDGVIPVPDDYDYEENVMTIYFSEPVKLVDADKVTAAYYAVNTEDIYEDKPVDAVKVLEINVDEDVVEVVLDSIPAGAHYAVSLVEGAFTDLAGNACPFIPSGYSKDAKGDLAENNLCGRMTVASFDLDFYKQDTITVITSMQQQIWLVVPEQNEIAVADSKVTGTVVYENATSKLQYNTYPTKMGFQWLSRYNSMLVYANEMESYTGHPDAQRGDMVTITIPEKYIFDKYGNYNNEFVIGPALYSYGYKVEDIVGTYECDGSSAYGTDYDEEAWGFTVAVSDDEEEGNVMITSYYGFDCKIYAEFDGDLGTLTMPIYYESLGGEEGEKYYYDFYTFAYYSCYKSQKTAMVFEMPTKGTLECGNDLPGYYFDVYNIPASGNIADITEDDYADKYDYNIFKGPFNLKAESTSAVKANSANRFFGAEKYSISLPCHMSAASSSRKLVK